MSRLIDLDKALAEAEDECRMSDDWKVSHEMMNVFKYQPIIKAIPIEWIKKWCNKEHNRKSLEERLLKRYGVITMLEDWEKENDGRNC